MSERKHWHHEKLQQHRLQQRHQGGRPDQAVHEPQHGHLTQNASSHDAEHRRPFDLAQAALDEMHAAGFKPEFAPEVAEQLRQIEQRYASGQHTQGIEDLRALGWSSIDNDTSRDLDQIEVAERTLQGIKLRVAVGDVAAAVAKDSPIDEHAQDQTQTIYTAVKNFPMLPLELSTGLTSLNENADRLAVMMTFTIGSDGEIVEEKVSLAQVRNRAQLAYSRVGPWLEKTAAGVVDNDVMSLRSDSAREHDEAKLDSGSLPENWLIEQ
jgi:exoribonuclease-2